MCALDFNGRNTKGLGRAVPVNKSVVFEVSYDLLAIVKVNVSTRLKTDWIVAGSILINCELNRASPGTLRAYT